MTEQEYASVIPSGSNLVDGAKRIQRKKRRPLVDYDSEPEITRSDFVEEQNQKQNLEGE